MRSIILFSLLAAAACGQVQPAKLFVFGGPIDFHGGAIGGLQRTAESFVVSVSDAQKVAQLREYLSRRDSGVPARPVLARVRLALGSDQINRNYSAPGAPLWDWHVAEVLDVGPMEGDGTTGDVVTARDGFPSSMKKFLTGEDYWPRPVVAPGQPLPIPVPIVRLLWFPVLMELQVDATPKLLNVSNRGYADSGNRSLITGFVVGGGTLSNLLIRGLGPSLGAYGVTEVLQDPRIELYRGNVRIAVNDTWIETSLNRNRDTGGAVPASDSPLAPGSQKEPAFAVSLPPGAYTVIIGPAAGTAPGVALIEVYQID